MRHESSAVIRQSGFLIIFPSINGSDRSITSAVLTPVPMLPWGSTFSGSRQRPGALPRSTVPKDNTHTHTERQTGSLSLLLSNFSWTYTDVRQAEATGDEIIWGALTWPRGGARVHHPARASVSQWQGPHTNQTALRNDRNPLSDPASQVDLPQ